MTARPTRDQLTRARLADLPPGLIGPDFGNPGVGIVHLGLGNFHCAHQAVYTERAMAAAGGDWAICGVSLRDSAGRCAALAAQDGLYSTLERGPDGTRATVVRSLRQALAAPSAETLLARLTDPAVRIVSLTVTEKGYCYDARTGGLDKAHPDVVHDLAQPDTPRTVPGLLVAALRRRRDNPFTVLSCDNLMHNGAVLRRVVLDFAAAVDPALSDWIAEAVAFPSTMVDRIVPATTDADREEAAGLLGVEDAWPVPCEPFSQWVIEDRFPLGRPAWERAGAQLVDDVLPFEQAKLRMLNGSHSAIAYLSLLGGHVTVDQAVADPDLHRFVHAMMTDEVLPTLRMPLGFDGPAYRDALLTRFANPQLRHKVAQISMDGSQKLPPRLLGTIADRLQAGLPVGRLALAVAAWMRFLRGRSDAGDAIEVKDPMADRLTTLARDAGDDDALLASLLAVAEIFPPALAADERLQGELRRALAALGQGARQAVAAYA